MLCDYVNYCPFADLPIIDATSRISDKPIVFSRRKVNLECPLLSGSHLTYKWYRNGVYLSSSTTGSLCYETSVELISLVGIYQCFVENSVGSDYAIIRILDEGTLILYFYSKHPTGMMYCQGRI